MGNGNRLIISPKLQSTENATHSPGLWSFKHAPESRTKKMERITRSHLKPESTEQTRNLFIRTANKVTIENTQIQGCRKQRQDVS